MIKSFDGDPTDNELRKLTPFLLKLACCPDVRPVSKKFEKFLKEPERELTVETKIKEPLERLQTVQEKVLPELSDKVRNFIVQKNKSNRAEMTPVIEEECNIEFSHIMD